MADAVGAFEEIVCVGFGVVGEVGDVLSVYLRRSVIERSPEFLECD